MTVQASEVAKMVLDKLSEAAQSVSQTTATVMPHVILAFTARRIAHLVTAVLVLVCGLVALKLSLKKEAFDSHNDPTVYLPLRIVSVLTVVVAVIAVTITLPNAIVAAVDPTGAFILSILDSLAQKQ